MGIFSSAQSSQSKSILIIGIVPPPVGGVSIHVKRLLERLDQFGIPYVFISIHKNLFWNLFKEIWFHRVIHLHIVNTVYSFIFAIVCFLLRKKLIITRHANVGKRSCINNFLEMWSLRLSSVPILLNQESYDLVKKYNPNARLMSVFIPPSKITKLPSNISDTLSIARNKYKYLIATNASNLAFDCNGKEVYGIIELIKLFRKYPNYFLIAATCNNNYYNYLSEKNISIPSNVYILREPVDYFQLLKYVDGMIRHTTTDGDAVSVREALYLNKTIFASDCVSRPQGVIVYHSIDELEKFLTTVHKNCYDENYVPSEENNDLIKLYFDML